MSNNQIIGTIGDSTIIAGFGGFAGWGKTTLSYSFYNSAADLTPFYNNQQASSPSIFKRLHVVANDNMRLGMAA